MADTKSNTGRSASMKVDTKLVRELAELLNETGLTEIEVEDGDRKIRVARGGATFSVPVGAHPAPHPAQPASPAAATPVAALAEPIPADHGISIRSPMVGTAYLFPEPGAEPFVRKGDRVKAGDTLLVVEAMKVMNPITATAEGIIEAILVENAQPVEFDQPLIVLG